MTTSADKDNVVKRSDVSRRLTFLEMDNNFEEVKKSISGIEQIDARHTLADQIKLANIEPGAEVNTVNKVNGKTGDVNLTKADVGLSNTRNVESYSKIETDALLGTPFSQAERSKLATVEAGATMNSSDEDLRDRSTHTGTQHVSTINGLGSAATESISAIRSGTTKSDVGLGNVNNTSDANKPVSTAQQTALDTKVAITNIVNTLTSAATNKPLSANMGKVLKGHIDNINDLLQSDTGTLDTLQEIVDYIQLNRSDLEALGISSISGLQNALDDKVDKVSGKGLSTNNYTNADKSKLANIEANATADQTAEEILTLLKTVDGSGSGIDADLLDGQDGSYYRNASNLNAGTVSLARLPASAKVGDTTYTAGSGLSLSGTVFSIDNPFNPSGTYSGLRAQATTKADVGLGNVDNYSRTHYDGRYLAIGAKAADSDLLDGQDVSYYLDASNLNAGTVSLDRLPASAKVGDTTYTAGSGLSLSGTVFSVDNPFNPTGSYSGLRAQATTKADVGLSNVDNYNRAHYDGRYLAVGAQAVDSDKLDGKHASTFYEKAEGLPSQQLATINSPSEVSYQATGSAILYPHLTGFRDGQGEMSFSDACASAAQYGARLPTIEELNAGICGGQGHSYDNVITWTCTPAGDGYVWGMVGVGNGTPTRLSIANDVAVTGYVVNKVVTPDIVYLEKIKRVDGNGSGLDSDTLDGKHASDFANSSHTHPVSNITGLSDAATTSVSTIRSGTTKANVGLGDVDNYSRTHYDGRYLAAGGKAADSDMLDGQDGSYYRNASYLNAGTVPLDRLPSSVKVGDTTYTAGSGLSLTGTVFSVDNPFNPTGSYSGLRAQGTTKADVGLGSVDNTSDANKPVSTAQQSALNAKVNTADVINSLTSTSTNKPLSANMGKTLKGHIDNINNLLQSDTGTLDTLQEIVDYIQLNRTDLENLGIASITGLQAALDSKAASSHNHSASDLTSGTVSLDRLPASVKVGNTTYTAGSGLSLTGTVFSVDNPFNPSGSYTSLRARGTLKADVGLGNVDNYSRAQYDARYLAIGAKAADSDMLDGQNGSYYLNASNLNVGTVPLDRLPASVKVGNTTYTAGSGLSLSGTVFSVDNPFDPSGTYSGLRAQATTKADVGLSNVPNWSSSTFNSRYWGIGVSTGYAPNIDLNDFQAGQGGYARSTQANYPPGGDGYNIVTIAGYGSSDLTQWAYPQRSNYQIWYRTKQGTTWSAWKEVLTTDVSDKFNSSGTYSGLRAQGTTKADVGLSSVDNYSRAHYDARYVQQNDYSVWDTSNYSAGLYSFDARDIASDGDLTYVPSPNDTQDRSASVLFSQGFAGNSWRGGLVVKGWNSSYSAWAISGPSTTNADEDFYLRSGAGTSWGTDRKILHSGNSDFFNNSGNYASLRARGTTKADVGLGSVENYNRAHYDGRYLLRSDNLTSVANKVTSFNNIKQVATTGATGVVEKATNAEALAGTANKYPDAAGVQSAINARLGDVGAILDNINGV